MKKLKIAGLILITIGLSGCFNVKSTDKFTYQKISTEQYKLMLSNSTDYYLVDVRTKAEYRKSHMNGAVNFSFLAFHFKKDVKNLERNKTVFLYCQTCHRSPLAARKMKKMGFTKVVDLKGGYQKWKL